MSDADKSLAADAARWRWLLAKMQESYDDRPIEITGEFSLQDFTLDCSMLAGYREHRRCQVVIGWGDLRDEPLGFAQAVDLAMACQ